MRIEPYFIRILVIVDFGWEVHDDRFLLTYTLPAMIDIGRDLDQRGIVHTQIELIDLLEGGGSFPGIVYHQLDHSLYTGNVIRLVLVEVH